MGSGPHPNVPYGIPKPPPRVFVPVSPTDVDENGMAKPNVAYRVTPFFWLISSLAYAGLLMWAFQAARKR